MVSLPVILLKTETYKSLLGSCLYCTGLGKVSNVITDTTLNQKYGPNISQEVKPKQSNFVYALQHFRHLTTAEDPSQCGRVHARCD